MEFRVIGKLRDDVQIIIGALRKFRQISAFQLRAFRIYVVNYTYIARIKFANLIREIRAVIIFVLVKLLHLSIWI